VSQQFLEAERAVFARFAFSATVRSVDLEAGGSARALVSGDGPDVVLLPGGSMPAAGWLPLMERLDGFRLHALELPGFCGPSDPLRLRPETIREDAVRFVSTALDALGLQSAPFIANSMGALWTFWTALDHPKRVDAIITMGCPALLPGTSAPLPMRLMSIPAIGRLMMRLVPPSTKQVDTALAGAGVDLTTWPELRDLVLSLERLPEYPSSWLDLLHATLRPSGPRAGTALTDDELAAITQPVQMLWGEDDPFGSVTAGERAAGLIPDTEFHLVPGGHSPWLLPDGETAHLASDFLHRRTITRGDSFAQ
jgi:pimeloyl-ACP methyl ester carboxylesterase